jgi:aminobenzoyl-glutamate utilization protein B
MKWIGPIEYTEEEQNFARGLQKSVGAEETGMNGAVLPMPEAGDDESTGSTDVGDVSWVVPTIQLAAATAPTNVPWHS